MSEDIPLMMEFLGLFFIFIAGVPALIFFTPTNNCLPSGKEVVIGILGTLFFLGIGAILMFKYGTPDSKNYVTYYKYRVEQKIEFTDENSRKTIAVKASNGKTYSVNANQMEILYKPADEQHPKGTKSPLIIEIPKMKKGAPWYMTEEIESVISITPNKLKQTIYK